MVDTFRATEGKGRCGVLDVDTTPEFGCKSFSQAMAADNIQDDPTGTGFKHTLTTHKSGAPWQYSRADRCPDCSGKGNAGDGSCDRCQGTGKVRYYDDGFIGEERTRLHPKEREMAAPPKCVGCGREMNREWVACPACGHRREMPAVPEIVALKLDAS